MNTYQKATILITGAWLPLLQVYMKAMRYAGAWMVAVIALGLATFLVCALRSAHTE